MPREFISEYGYDPERYLQRLSNQLCDRCPEFSERTVEEVIFVDDGPIGFLVWFALDNYEEHTFFYQDESPNREILQRFLFLSPSKQAMPNFKKLLQKYYDEYRELEVAKVLEIRDTYLPKLGKQPRVNVGFCHEPEEDYIISGVSGSPRVREPEIIEDIDKIVPEKSLEKLVSQSVWNVNTQIKEDADRHTIATNIRNQLDQDSDFRCETTKQLPSGIHPNYTGTDAELWQKPASRVDFMDGSQGFLRLWIPVADDDITLIDVTAGEYDRERIVDEIKEQFDPITA